MKISFVIPVYQNAGAISKTYEKINLIFTKDLSQYSYEIIFIDDGSKDESLKEILSLRDIDPRVKGVTFTRNFGQMAAMLAGFKEARGDAIINISADLQDPVELIPKMINKWRDGSETVICYRTDREDPLSSKLFSRLAYSILRMSNSQIPPGGFDFVLMDRKVMDEFNSIDVRHRFFQGDLLWAGYRTSFIPYVRLQRVIGKSQYNFSKKLKNFLDAILDSSYLPIRLISLIGLITSSLGVIYSISIFISWLRNETPFQGWAPLMIVTLLIGGVIMIMLGIIGEYIWRINEEVRKRPNYVVREKFL
jgi:glycosyltransferase involved in cell wall biosynthesis